jgi:hypothetical protein
MHTKHNPTIASAASPSTADPKMADLCNHTAHASLPDGFSEDGYFKRPIQPNIMEISGRSVVGFLLVLGWQTSDTRLARRKLGKKKTPAMAAAVVPWPPWRPGPDAEA